MRRSNLILTFVESCCLLVEGAGCDQKELWEAFDQWRREADLFDIGRNTFYKRVSELFPREGGKVKRLFIKDPEEWEYWEAHELRRVYLISDGKFVKIGVSSNPEYRKGFLQVGSSQELVILATFPGDEKEEAELHAHFSQKRERGEWFLLTPEDILWIFGYFAYSDIE